MSASPRSGAARRPCAAAANEAIRQFVRAHGDRSWSRADLAELDRLRADWQAAVQDAVPTAA